MAKLLVFPEGAKGGVGKTSFLETLACWYRARGITPYMVDADQKGFVGGGALARYYQGGLPTLNLRDPIAIRDFVASVAEGDAPVTLLDLPPSTAVDFAPFFGSLDEGLLRRAGVRVIAVAVLPPTAITFSEAMAWVEVMGHHVDYLTAFAVWPANEAGDRWTQEQVRAQYSWYYESELGQTYRAQYSPREIVYHALARRYWRAAEHAGMTVDQLLVSKNPVEADGIRLGHIFHRSVLAQWQRGVYAEFDSVADWLVPDDAA